MKMSNFGSWRTIHESSLESTRADIWFRTIFIWNENRLRFESEAIESEWLSKTEIIRFTYLSINQINISIFDYLMRVQNILLRKDKDGIESRLISDRISASNPITFRTRFSDSATNSSKKNWGNRHEIDGYIMLKTVSQTMLRITGFPHGFSSSNMRRFLYRRIVYIAW